jgi:asparagine synthase (glutamine-hydrolysing)
MLGEVNPEIIEIQKIDREKDKLLKEVVRDIIAAKTELDTATKNYEFADSAEMVDLYSYRIIAAQTKYNLLLKKAKENGVEVMLCGQGSDELFAGYHKFEGLTEEELQTQMEKGIESVMASDIKRDGYMLKQSGIGLVAPYADKDFIDFALNIPISLKIKDGIKKYIIRKVAEKRGLPEYIALRPKNAMQYSSGIQKVIDKINKENKKNEQ